MEPLCVSPSVVKRDCSKQDQRMLKKRIASATIFGDVGCEFVNDRKLELSEILVQFPFLLLYRIIDCIS